MTEVASFHETLKSWLDTLDDAELSGRLVEVRAADIAEAFHSLDEEDRSRLLFALPPHTAAEVVVMLDEAVRGDVVEGLDTRSLSEIIAELPLDDAADMLGELPPEEAAQILAQIATEQSDKLGELLQYDEDTAGGIMTPEVVKVPASKTVADAVEYVREATPYEELHEIYIVDDEGKLLGTVPLRRLVTNKAGTRLEAICDRDPVTVNVRDDQETVVQVFRKYDVSVAAVVDDGGRLLGRITYDDLLDVAHEEAAEDLFRMAGTDAAEFETTSVLRAAQVRLSWLLPCMVGTLVTAGVLLVSEGQFDAALFGALVSFAPMIGAMSGNSGIQISTVIVRGLATGELGPRAMVRSLAREGRIAMAMAPTCGVAAWALASIGLNFLHTLGLTGGPIDRPDRVALAIGAAMTCAIMLSGVLGICLPFLFRRLGIDPAIASGPLVTTLNDGVSVTLYMLLAMLIAR